tara:strand:+ start:28575 stop:28679 length:105 start_codon:yes stop_codon:yes gene_type:complete
MQNKVLKNNSRMHELNGKKKPGKAGLFLHHNQPN